MAAINPKPRLTREQREILRRQQHELSVQARAAARQDKVEYDETWNAIIEGEEARRLIEGGL